MSKLIQDFKDEHLQISDLLLKARNIGEDNPQCRALLLSAKKMLLAHLNKEDRYLYPVLKEAAKTDSSLASTLQSYAQDMDKISTDVMTFFNTYEDGDHTAENFQSDYKNIIIALSKRIAMEETVLYKAYDQQIKSN